MPADSAHLGLADAELVRRARQGDASAFKDLVGRHAARLLAMAAALLGDAADAEDVVQETFAGAFRGLRGFEGRSSVKTWLTSILMRQTAMHRRGSGRRAARLLRAEAASETTTGAASATGAADARMDVAAAIQLLSPEHRDVVALREFEGLSYDEMTQVLGIPRGTVESRLFRARRQLQEHLKAYLP
ncbi:MAG TPA: sigma-70 family RNA polymerase sigma factor [Phycisphaerae bacterium]|nr:sigma-70 family RNA polymerase sigma factor [Phycisphaerae bacterium]